MLGAGAWLLDKMRAIICAFLGKRILVHACVVGDT